MEKRQTSQKLQLIISKTYHLKIFIIFIFFCSGSISARTATDSIGIYLAKNEDLKALKYAINQSDYLFKNKLYNKWCANNIQKSKIYLKLNDHQKAIGVLFETLKFTEKKQLKFEKVLVFNEIGKVYQLTLDKTKSYKYFKSAENMAMELGNDTLKAYCQQGLFVHSMAQNNETSARFYMKSIKDLYKNNGNSDQIYRSYSNYASYNFKFGQGELAKKYLDTAIYYASKNRKIKYLKVCYANLGYYYFTVEKNFKKGEEQYLKSLALTPKDTISQDATDDYLNLSYAYEQMNDFKTANKYMMKYIDNMVIIYQDKVNSNLRDAETRYQIEKVETEYKKRQQELLEEQSKNQKIFLVIIALIIILSILLYFFLQNMRLKEKNKFKDIESRVQQNIINATIDGQELERKKIASVLHDNISAQLSSAGLHLSAFSAITKTDSQEIAKTRAILKEAHDKVRDLSHELLPVLLAKFGLLYALQDLCEKNSNSLLHFEYSGNVFTFKRFNEEFEMKVYFIVTELLNNILKHSEATEAELTINEEKSQLKITVKDNGKGFKTTKTTDEGFGLTQIRARIQNMNGTFKVDSKPDHGTTVTLNIPVVE